jgi:hypothetical protein
MAKRGVGRPKQSAGSKTKEQVSKTAGAEQEPQKRSSVVGTTWAPFEPVNDAGPPMLPDGPGYMPLTSAAHWIASKGGTTLIGTDEQFWRAAFDDLLARIASGDVEVIGRRDSLNEFVPGHLFARIRISFPYSELSVETLFGDAPYLDCVPLVNDEDWQRESNDKLYLSGRRPTADWTHLQVRKTDVARLWPPPSLASESAVAKIGQRAKIKAHRRTAVKKAIVAVYGPFGPGIGVTEKMRESAVNKWLIDNGMSSVSLSTIRRAVQESQL